MVSEKKVRLVVKSFDDPEYRHVVYGIRKKREVEDESGT